VNDLRDITPPEDVPSGRDCQSLVVLAGRAACLPCVVVRCSRSFALACSESTGAAPDRWAMQELQRIDALQLPAAAMPSDFTRWFPTSPVVIWSYVFS